jgi:hypothetical protein
MLSNLGEGQLCQLVGICSESHADAPSTYLTPSVQGNPSLECQFCQKVIDHWVAVWTANTTEDEFKEVL